MTFKEKAFKLLKYLYENGGKDYVPTSMVTSDDKYVMICEADDKAELDRIMDYLFRNRLLEGNPAKAVGGYTYWLQVVPTDHGIAEVEKSMPNIPLIGLVNQTITTGDPDIDSKINHAKKLFFGEGSTWDDKRSACESLSHVLEGIKNKLYDFFADADVKIFFRLVNDFDIRHNNTRVTQLKFEEQLEWVFYTLLNTINTYTKLKAKLAK